jgi:hypothetical protein
MNFTQDELDNEIWKPYKNTSFEVSNLGRIKNKKTNKITIGAKCTKPSRSDYYYRFSINNKMIKAHRAVYATFNPHEDITNLLVHHINDIKTDNRLINLQSIELSVHTSHHNSGEKHNFFKGLKGQFSKDGVLLKIFLGTNDILNAGFVSSRVYEVLNGKRPHHIGYIFRRFPIGYVPIIGKTYDLFSPIFGISKPEKKEPVPEKQGQLEFCLS